METYLHISNSGVTIGVEATEYGPCITLRGDAFGHTLGSMRLYVTPKVLAVLGDMFKKAAEGTYAPPYVNAVVKAEKKDW